MSASGELSVQPEDPYGEEFDLFENLNPRQIEELRRQAVAANRPDPSGAAPARSDTVKVTVNLLRKAFDALEASAGREGLSYTDVINRALLAYEQLSANPDAAFRLPRDGRS